MNKLNDKKIEWAKKLKAGDPDYKMITRVEDRWYFLTECHIEPILSLKTAVDGGAGLRKEYSYHIAAPDTDGLNFTAIMKEGRELLIEDQNGQVAFGIAGIAPPANAILIYFRTETEHVFVFGGKETCSLQMFGALPLEQTDENTCAIDDIFSESEEAKFLILT